jgi:HAD superfamily hydrolase (TIGR01509 family)
VKRLVIFDCDGVLVDSERLSHEVLCEMLAEHGVDWSLQQALERFMGGSAAVTVERWTALTGVGGDVFLPAFERRSVAAFEARLGAVPGVVDVLDSLDAPYCVASNGPHAKMRCTLGLTGLLPRFDGRVFSADDVARPKPAPDLFLHAAATLGAMPADCVVVEDSPTGVAAARAAGMRVLGYAAMTPVERLRAAGADAVFERMDQLLPLIGGRG